MMLAVPRKGDCSKVSIELSRCKVKLARDSLALLRLKVCQDDARREAQAGRGPSRRSCSRTR